MLPCLKRVTSGRIGSKCEIEWKNFVAKDYHYAKYRHCHQRHWLVQGTESSVQPAETCTVVVTTPASEVFHLMPFSSISQKLRDYIHAYRKEKKVFRQMMRLKTYKSHSKVPEQESFTWTPHFEWYCAWFLLVMNLHAIFRNLHDFN